MINQNNPPYSNSEPLPPSSSSSHPFTLDCFHKCTKFSTHIEVNGVSHYNLVFRQNSNIL